MLIRFLVTFPCWGFIIITLDSKTKKEEEKKQKALIYHQSNQSLTVFMRLRKIYRQKVNEELEVVDLWGFKGGHKSCWSIDLINRWTYVAWTNENTIRTYSQADNQLKKSEKKKDELQTGNDVRVEERHVRWFDKKIDLFFYERISKAWEQQRRKTREGDIGRVLKYNSHPSTLWRLYQ